MKQVAYSNTFKKDFKTVSKYPQYKKKENFFKDGLEILQNGKHLPKEYDDLITLIRIGSHSDLGLTENFIYN